MLSAKEALDITKQNIDTAKDMNKQKLETLEKRIRKASTKGLNYIWYDSFISYFMYCKLIECGYNVSISHYTYNKDAKFKENNISCDDGNNRSNLITWYKKGCLNEK